MTEAEWLSCTDPQEMLTWMQQGDKVSDRKLRLFAVACCRRIWHLFHDERVRKVIEVAEQFADGQVGPGNLRSAQVAAEQVPDSIVPRWGAVWGSASKDALEAAWECLREAAGWGKTSKEEQRAEVPFLRDIFCNPFRSVTIDPAWLTWNNGTVVKLAQAIYDDRAFDRLPILADALEESGCDNIDILWHCRDAGEHVRGCWVLDLILGKE